MSWQDRMKLEVTIQWLEPLCDKGKIGVVNIDNVKTCENKEIQIADLTPGMTILAAFEKKFYLARITSSKSFLYYNINVSKTVSLQMDELKSCDFYRHFLSKTEANQGTKNSENFI